MSISPPPLFEAVVFDFDYTLADSSRGIIECVNLALAELGLAEASPEAIRATIGLCLQDTLSRLAGPQEPGRYDEFTRLFVERADEIMVARTVLLDLVPATVTALKETGLALGIVSTKFRYRIETILEREDLLTSFDVVVGGEDVMTHKPDPEGLLTAIDRLGTTPANTLYVGDSVTDAETAKRACVPFVAVLSGVTPREAFRDYSVVVVLDSLAALSGMFLSNRMTASR